MFIGHFALGFAAKRATPRASLGILFLAAQFADVLWPFLVAAGVEQVRIDPGNTPVTPLDFVSYPYSHSLVMLIAWGLLLAWIFRRIDRRAFGVIAALVVSHWVLDFVTHRPDLPLYPGGPKVGLGMWYSLPLTATGEVLMYAAGLWIYARATRGRDGIGRWGFASLAAVLLLLYVANLVSGPPPSVAAIYLAGIFGFLLFTAWAWWADRHRDAV
jgi:LexA-binding, inner membrane-associated putative hydrolase